MTCVGLEELSGASCSRSMPKLGRRIVMHMLNCNCQQLGNVHVALTRYMN